VKNQSRHAGRVAIRRAVETARAVGLDVAGFDLLPDGAIRILDARSMQHPRDEFEKWDQAGRLG
jgi:hypothetical protein